MGAWEIIRRTLNEVIDSLDEVTTDSTFGSNLFVNKIAGEAILPQTALDDIFNAT